MKSRVQRSGLVLVMIRGGYASTSKIVCADMSRVGFTCRNPEAIVVEGPGSCGFEGPEVMQPRLKRPALAIDELAHPA